MTTYTPKDFTHLLGMKGFSDTMLTNHFTLYEGYVKNSNLLWGKLDGEIESGSTEYYELKRRLAWEIDGMRMHELYFENLSKEKKEIGEKTKALLEKSFSSLENWQKSFNTNCLMRGIGWIMLLQDNQTKEVFHTWIGEHNQGHILDCKVLLVMDMWEHAYMTDYGIKKVDYIDAFIQNINWEVVESRL